MPRGLFDKENPECIRQVEWCRYFKRDLQYIAKCHSGSFASFVRDAVHEKVIQMREAEALPVMDKDARESFILKGRLPRGVRYTEKKDPGVYFNPDPAPKIVFHQDKIKGPSAAVILSWSKHDRDTYILTGQVPA